MMGNGLANIIAAAIVAIAILWTGGFGGKNANTAQPMTEEEMMAWYARAVGDIRNDIVVNCGCCGEEQGRRADKGSF